MDYKRLRDRVKGIVVVMVTPFKKNYEIDVEGLKKLTRFLIDSGIKEGTGVLVPTGSSGECPMLTGEERKEIFEIVKKEAGDTVPILGGCNHTDTRTVIKLAHYAEEAGLDGVMISPPYYWKPTEEIVLTHFKAIAKDTNMGIMVYNNWFASQLDIPVETIVKLINEVPNIVALKENTQSLAKFGQVIDSVGDKISVINGNGEPNEPYASSMGAKGFVTAEACIIPKTCVDIYKSEVECDYKKAKEIIQDASELLDFFFSGTAGSDYITRIKAAMNSVGLPGGIPRLPLLPVDEKFKTELKEITENYKLAEQWNDN